MISVINVSAVRSASNALNTNGHLLVVVGRVSDPICAGSLEARDRLVHHRRTLTGRLVEDRTQCGGIGDDSQHGRGHARDDEASNRSAARNRGLNSAPHNKEIR